MGVGGNHAEMRDEPGVPDSKGREADREPAIGAKLNGDERINSAVKMKAEVRMSRRSRQA